MKFILFILLSSQLFAQSFEQLALDYLIKKFSEYDKIEIESRNKNDKDEKIIIDENREPKLGKGFILIPIFIESGTDKKQSLITCKVHLYKNVLIAAKDIKRQETLSENLLRKQLIEVTSLFGSPLTDFNEITNRRTKSFFKEGEILLKEKTELIPMINTGDKILAEVKFGNVIVTADAFARQNGNEGDVIRIISNNKILNAKVVDHNKVIVE